MQEEPSVILTKQLLQELYSNDTTSLKESSKKVRHSALNKLPDNFSVNILNETETMMKVKELNLSNTYKSILDVSSLSVSYIVSPPGLYFACTLLLLFLVEQKFIILMQSN